MNEEPRQETEPGWCEGLDWFGKDYGLTMVSLHRALVVRHWEMTVLNKWQRQNCKNVKIDFGNFLPKSLTLPLHALQWEPWKPLGRGDRIAWWERLSPLSHLKGLLLPSAISTTKQAPQTKKQTKKQKKHLNLNLKHFLFIFVRGLSTLGTGWKRVNEVHVKLCQLPVTKAGGEVSEFKVCTLEIWLFLYCL